MKRPAVFLMSMFVAALVTAGAGVADERERLTLDEGTWVAFYDLPSRRFRNVRSQFVQRNFEQVSRDLTVAISFFQIEAARTVPELASPMGEMAARLEYIRDNVAADSVSAADLDAAFARAHWLLTQHYLVLAQRSRDAERHRNAGQYLIATAHHLERSVLWSNARIDRDTVRALDSLRAMSARLRESDDPARVYRERPIRLAAKTVARMGKHLDRTYRIEARMEPES